MGDADEFNRRQFISAGLMASGASLVLGNLANAAPTSSENNTPLSFTGKRVLVTGGTSGIGKEVALTYASLGAKVFFTGKTQAHADDVLAKMSERGLHADFYKADITIPKDVRRLFARVEKVLGGIDIAVNSAGIFDKATDFATEPLETFEDVIKVNLVGTLHCLQEEISIMKRGGGGSIITLLSGKLRNKDPRHPGIVASKQGLLGLIQSLAIRYREDKIRINGISPGFVERVGAGGEYLEKIKSEYPDIQRLIPVQDVVSTITWLSSGNTLPVSGENLFVSGNH